MARRLIALLVSLSMGLTLFAAPALAANSPATAPAYVRSPHRLKSHTSPSSPAQPFSWGTPIVPSLPNTYGINAVSCPTPTFCAAADGTTEFSTFNGSTWTMPTILNVNFAESGMAVTLSCVSATFCMWASSSGYYSIYNGSSWSAVAEFENTGGYGSNREWVSCVPDGSGQFCMIIDSNGNYFTYSSTNGMSAAQSLPDTGQSATDLSCVTSTFCMVVDNGGNVMQYSGSTFTDTQVTPENSNNSGYLPLDSISCASTNSCMAEGADANNYPTTYSFDGTAWTALGIIAIVEGSPISGGSANPIGSLSCVVWGTSPLCIFEQKAYADVSVYENGQWSYVGSSVEAGFATTLLSLPPQDASCMASGECIVAASGYVFAFNANTNVISAPANISPAFQVGSNAQGDSIPEYEDTGGAISCPVVTGADAFCAVLQTGYGDFSGLSVEVFDPLTGNQWANGGYVSPSAPDVATAVSCLDNSSELCVVVGMGGDYFTLTDATGTPDLSGTEPTGDSNNLSGVSCGSESSYPFCVAVDSAGNVLTYSYNATQGAYAWSSPVNIDGATSLTAVSCVSSTACVAVDSAGNVLMSSNPLASSPTWTSAAIDSLGLVSLSCPTSSFCVAIDASGNAMTYNGFSWSMHALGSGVESVSCASATFCVTSGSGAGTAIWNGSSFSGPIVTDRDMAFANPAPFNFVYGPASSTISCPTAEACVMFDSTGNSFVGLPAGNAAPDGAILAAENYGGGNNPSWNCACRAPVTKGPSTAASVNRSEPVDTLNGDLSETWKGVTIPAVAQPLTFNLTYDAQLSQTELVAQQNSATPYGGGFGFGWTVSDLLNASEQTSSSGTVTGATVFQGNGSEVTYSATSSSCLTLGTDYYSRTIAGSNTTFCAYPRITSELGYYSADYALEFTLQGGVGGVDTFDMLSGQVAAQVSTAGDSHASGASGVTSFTYDMAPGFDGCPTTAEAPWINFCDQEYDLVGQRSILYEFDADGIIQQVTASSGQYNFSYASPGYGPGGTAEPAVSLGTAANANGKTTTFAYDNTSSGTAFVDDMTSIEDPNESATCSAGGTCTSTQFTYGSSTSPWPGYVASEIAPAASDSANPAGGSPSFTTTFTYADSASSFASNGGQVTTTTYSDSSSVTDTYVNDLLTETTLGSGSGAQSWFYYHDPATLLTADTVAPGGQVTETSYTTDPVSGLLQSAVTTDSEGYVSANVYDSANPKNQDSLCWQATSDSIDNLPVDPSCGSPPSSSSSVAVTSYQYDSFGDLVAMVNPVGDMIGYVYDADSDGDSTLALLGGDTDNDPSFDAPYANEPRMVAIGTAADGPFVETLYNYIPTVGYNQGQVTGTIDEAGDQTSYSYDAAGHLVQEIAPNANTPGTPTTAADWTTTNTYDNAGNLLSVQAPAGGTTSYTYDADGHVLTTTDANGNLVTNAYDQQGRLCWTYQGPNPPSLSCGQRAPGFTTYEYVDGTNNVFWVTDPDGNTTTYYYDNPAYPSTVTEVTEGDGTIVSYVLNANGQVCGSGPGDVYSGQTTPTCDSAASTLIPNGTFTTYNANGNVASVTDATGNETTYTYADPVNPVLVSTKSVCSGTDCYQPLTTSYTYDGAGEMVQRQDAMGNVTSYGYEPNGALCVRADGSFSIASCQVPSGATGYETVSYDHAGRRATMAEYVGGAQQDSATYGYDLNSNLTSVATTGPASQTVGYLYNFNNDPICVSYPVDLTGGGCGTLTAQGTASGTASTTNTIATMGYNNGDQMTSLTDWLGNTTNFTYNQTGLASGITYPTSTGSSVGLTYDAAQNVTGEYATTAAGTDTTSWTPNPNNLISSVTLPGQTTSNAYSYNAWNQMTQAPSNNAAGQSQPPPETTYGYYLNGSICYSDPAGGSGACDAPPSTAATYGYNGFSQLCYLAQGGATGSCVTPPSGAETFTYNADGQRTLATGAGPGGSNLSYGWNAQGTLCWEDPTGAAGTCSAPPSTATTYEYNGDGLRVGATSGGRTQAFTWDTATTSIPRIIMDGQNAYLYGPGVFGSGTAPIEQITLPTAANNNTQTPSYLISDPTGVREVIDGSGTTQTTDCYSAYGTQTTTGSGTTTPFGYQGGYTDPTGLVYLVDRYYDPNTGQFVSVDPLVDLTGQPYEFVGADPANGTDPLGACNKQGNGNAWDLINPWSSNNPIRCHVEKNPNSGFTHMLRANPAFQAILHGYSAYETAQNPCSSNWSIAWQSSQALFYSVATLGTAYVGVEVGAVAGPWIAAHRKSTLFAFCILVNIFGSQANPLNQNDNISAAGAPTSLEVPAPPERNNGLCTPGE